MRLFALMLAVTLAISPAQASIPQSKTIGPWMVIWITSLSGTDGDDASVMFVQEVNKNEAGVGDSIEARWLQESIWLTMRIQNCNGEDEDFSRSLEISTDGWLKLSEEEASRVFSGVVKGWAREARLECKVRRASGIFRFDRLQEASRLFDSWVNYFAPPVQEVLNAQTN